VGLKTPMNPPRELGWYRRRKHVFFQEYNKLAEEFAKKIKVHPRQLSVKTELYQNFDINDVDSLKDLAEKVDRFLIELGNDYKELNIQEKPFCFIKNNAGTYGLAVLQVHSGKEILDWNSKTKKKMKAAKGGREVTELIIQEGIPTRFTEKDGGSAEPCIYMVGCGLVGGFLRTHSEKGPDESLNSPGAVYKKLCMSDLQVDQKGCPMENVYGWAAKMGTLAVALEAQALSVEFKNYENKIRTCT
jgi:glutamate--cysteine ligase